MSDQSDRILGPVDERVIPRGGQVHTPPNLVRLTNAGVLLLKQVIAQPGWVRVSEHMAQALQLQAELQKLQPVDGGPDISWDCQPLEIGLSPEQRLLINVCLTYHIDHGALAPSPALAVLWAAVMPADKSRVV